MGLGITTWIGCAQTGKGGGPGWSFESYEHFGWNREHQSSAVTLENP